MNFFCLILCFLRFVNFFILFFLGGGGGGGGSVPPVPPLDKPLASVYVIWKVNDYHTAPHTQGRKCYFSVRNWSMILRN